MANGKYWKKDISFKYIGSVTPQSNHLIELDFTVIGEIGRAFMHPANVPTKIRYRAHNEVYRTVTVINGLVVIDIYGNQATRHNHFCGSNPELATKLRSRGEV